MDDFAASSILARQEQERATDLQRGLSNDRTLQSSSTVGDHSPVSIVHCPSGDPCPSCGVDRNISYAETVLKHIGPKGTAADYNSVTGMGSVRSHSILAQSIIRKTTRSMIREYMEKKALGDSACGLIAPDAWNDFSQRYKAALLDAATQPIKDDLSEHAKSLARTASRESTLPKLQKLELDWKKRQQDLESGNEAIVLPSGELDDLLVRDVILQYTGDQNQARVIGASSTITISGKAVTGDQKILALIPQDSFQITFRTKRDPAEIKKEFEQRKKEIEQAKEAEYAEIAKDKVVTVAVRIVQTKSSDATGFKQGEALNEKQWTAYRDMMSGMLKEGEVVERSREAMGNDGARIRIKVKMKDQPNNFLVKTQELNKNGKAEKTIVQEIIDNSPQEEQVITNNNGLAPPWKETIFANLMYSPFLDESQCRYCEDLQKDYSLVQRAHYLLKHPEMPPEFVGVHLLGRLSSSSSGGVEGYMDKWLDAVVEALKTRLAEICKEESDKGQKKKEREGKKNLAAPTADQIDGAMTHVLSALQLSKEKFSLNNVMSGMMQELLEAGTAPKPPDITAAIRLKLKELEAQLDQGAGPGGKPEYKFK